MRQGHSHMLQVGRLWLLCLPATAAAARGGVLREGTAGVPRPPATAARGFPRLPPTLL
jgi:hypothetical protein